MSSNSFWHSAGRYIVLVFEPNQVNGELDWVQWMSIILLSRSQLNQCLQYVSLLVYVPIQIGQPLSEQSRAVGGAVWLKQQLSHTAPPTAGAVWDSCCIAIWWQYHRHMGVSSLSARRTACQGRQIPKHNVSPVLLYRGNLANRETCWH